MSVLGSSKRRRTRRLGLAAVTLALVATLTGCGDQMGSGVVVNGTAVSESDIQSGAEQAIAESTEELSLSDQIVTTRSVATAAVNHQLVQAASAASGVTVDEAQVTATLAQLGENRLQFAQAFKIPVSAVDQTVRDLLTQQAMLTASPGGVPVTDIGVTFDVVTATDRDDAVQQRLDYLKDPAALSVTATATGTGGVGQQASLVAQPDLGQTGLFSAGVGEIVIFSLGGQYYVARITDRKTSQTSLTMENQPQNAEQQLAFFNLVMQSYAQQADVAVNPRFGTWDSLALAVVPGDSGV